MNSKLPAPKTSRPLNKPTARHSCRMDPDAVLRERARLLAVRPESETAPGAMLELAAFHLGNDWLGVPSGLVHEVQPLNTHHWTRVPCTPAFITGAINLRGHIYSILDIAIFFGQPHQMLQEKAHILLVRGGFCADGKEMELTILADDVPQIQQVPLASLSPLPAASSNQANEFIRGIAPGMLMVIDLERLLSDPRLIVQDDF